MTSRKHLLIAVLACSTLFSCSTPKAEFGVEGNVIICGKMLNVDKHPDKQTLSLINRNIIDRDSKFTAVIEENGDFRFEFPSAFTHDVYVIYGAFITLVCSPGDSLYLEIDADIQDDRENRSPNGDYFVKFPDTDIGRTNHLIAKFRDSLPREKYIYQNANDAEREKTADEYKAFILQREKEYRAYLLEFTTENKTTSLFDRWADDQLKYETWSDLLRYRWTYPYHNKLDQDSFELPEEYFSFLEDYDMDDKDLFSFGHSQFLHEFSMYAGQNPKDSLTKVRELHKNKERDAAYKLMFEMIRNNADGFTQDLFITKRYLSTLKGQNPEAFEAIYDSTFTNDEYFLSVVNSGYEDLKNYLSNQNTGEAVLASLSTSITSELIASIGEKYKNKVIYIDFWAPWCGPCMAEMPHSKEMQKHYKNDDVVFLFLGCSCKEDSWKATIANKNLTGEHILLTDDQYHVLQSQLGISGIPHYTLIDKKGNIVSKKAFRPSNKEKFIEEIDKLLI